MTSVQPLQRALGRRVAPTSTTALVAAGDLACIGLFVFVGSVNGHGVDPVGQAGRLVGTYATFLAGWALASLAGGLYAADALDSPTRIVARTVPAWVGAALVAQGIRATSLVHGDAAVTFYLVSVGVGLALLVPWRLLVGHLTAGE